MRKMKMKMMMKVHRVSLVALVMVMVITLPSCATANNSDRFNYGDTDTSGAYNTYGLSDWSKVTCSDPGTCAGWPDDYVMGLEWKITDNGNGCRWCPKGEAICDTHHQSPIDLKRDRGIIGSANENECIDTHWMKYEDSTCTWQQLVKTQAFTIERHALKMTQPLEITPEVTRLDCPANDGRRFGRIDFSRGFHDWWFLSHIDFKVPSEHTQEGKRYSAEVQMAHFYSLGASDAGVDNQMAHVAIFLEASDACTPYPFLDRVICQWRRAEDEVRELCGLPSVQSYPGCFPFSRGHERRMMSNPVAANKANNVTTTDTATIDKNLPASRNLLRPAGTAAHDVIRDNYSKEDKAKRRIEMDDVNFRGADWTDQQWETWIQDMYREDKDLEQVQNDEREFERELFEGSQLRFHNYQFLIDVRTEYYYRYSGTQTVPPCWGPYESGSRGNTNHWRVMKDPIRVHPRQIAEMERLLKNRIAPPDDPFHACQVDTAGAIDEEGHISVARPLQAHSYPHFESFCECKDWPSKWPEDRAWCEIADINERFYDRPYHFGSTGF